MPKKKITKEEFMKMVRRLEPGRSSDDFIECGPECEYEGCQGWRLK
jgi:hypothetical protein